MLFIFKFLSFQLHIFSGPVKYVLLGAIDLKEGSVTDDCPEEYQVTEIIPHPNFTISSRYNDIGLLRINIHVKFHPYIRPACLPNDSIIPVDLTVMGWGATGIAVPAENVLVQVVLNYYNHTECTEVYKNGESHRFALGIIEETQMCAGSKYGGFDICVVRKFKIFVLIKN